MATLFLILLLASLASLVVGLVKPAVFLRFYKRELGRKQIALIFGGLTLASFIGIGSFAPSPAPENSIITQNNSVTTTQSDTQEVQNVSEPSDDIKASETIHADTNTAKASQGSVQPKQESNQSPLYSVVSVVDGDTVKLSIEGKTQTIRLIGMDTPETVDPRKPVQCFGKEASNKAKELLTGRSVRIETDPSQGTLDKYGRTLGISFEMMDFFYNKYMIEQGFAHEYTYNIPYKYQSEFKAAEKAARENQRGLWSPDTCNGDTTSTSESSNTQPATAPSGGKFYTSSYHTSKYYYPEACDAWKSLSQTYLKSFNSLEALLEAYPSRTKSPQCE